MTDEQFEALVAMIQPPPSMSRKEAIEAARVLLVDPEKPAEEPKPQERILPAQLAKDACPVCGGSGSLGGARCHPCKGTGKKAK